VDVDDTEKRCTRAHASAFLAAAGCAGARLARASNSWLKATGRWHLDPPSSTDSYAAPNLDERSSVTSPVATFRRRDLRTAISQSEAAIRQTVAAHVLMPPACARNTAACGHRGPRTRPQGFARSGLSHVV